ncbi:tyrosine-type recombinase/integrase [Microbispora sp. NPDC046933]|uniref:tyrosine-type recombinase/integrase n=1 Tax=Microbispora sp. NPDC046933 TaxID=3155618 RepID=UPI0033F467F3
MALGLNSSVYRSGPNARYQSHCQRTFVLTDLLPFGAQHQAERAEAGELWEDHDLLFPTSRGRPMERSEDYKMWKALLRQAGVREAHLHDARHTAGTLLVEQGVHIRVVQEILGRAG